MKQQLRTAQVTAQRRLNTQLIELYWSIGPVILERQVDQGWGSAIVGRFADDLVLGERPDSWLETAESPAIEDTPPLTRLPRTWSASIGRERGGRREMGGCSSS
ncbi:MULTISPECIES: DUF1016 N-terminal domain-containing protein [Clavibacter]|uniref:DUF1016 N-terminal domain-containing protein n=1 Tax=Clavibacter seminis TaxID=2860285 RepID=A0ABY3TIT5_9MICO|nr:MULTISPECIES: DUF1016 N-terminal domain-containing protein [Clavibacter]UKF26731.1 DUF1016 N-terminal domain-containing protein [Clavibacter sp. A6099]